MTHISPQPPIETGGITLPELVLSAARLGDPDRPAVVAAADGAPVSYRLLSDRIRAVAAGLAARGFGRGDVLALWMPNLPPWTGLALGAMAAGGTVTGAVPSYTERELAGQLADARARFLVTLPSMAPAALAAAEAAGVEEVFTLAPAGGATPVQRLLGDPAAFAPPPGDRGADVALLPYSSGTTGLPKGVMLTHDNLVAAVRQANRALRLTPDDTVLALPPFAHVMGFVVTLAVPLAAGARIVTLPRFDVEAFLRTIERERVTFLVVPPPVMAVLAAHPLVERCDLRSLALIACGGAPLAPALQESVARRFPWATVGQGYGMTETTAVIALPDRDVPTPAGAAGRLAPSTEVKVVAPDGSELPSGEEGELLVRGPQNMAGYLGRPDATAATVGADGWLRTGDLATVDADGHVHVVERLKELIKVDAHQVAPAELEALLVTHPGVADAAVLGRPDERHGEVPVAMVIPRGELDPAELRAWAADRVAPHKRLRDVTLVESLPRTPAGKLLRRELRDRVAVAA
jgi:acyl-CoA synthetase (AMP-forming)/AMP-acid ligase II